MNINLKIQNIGGNPEASEQNEIALTHEFEVPNDTLEKQRGRLFISFHIQADKKINVSDAAKLFLESIREEYYRTSDETPLHALEKALNRARKVVKSLGPPNISLKMSFATALIWNRVLYTSYLGTPAVYLVRGQGVRNLGINPAESEIWTNSGILDNEDVVIIGTEEFAKIYPPQEIINSLGGLSQKVDDSGGKNKIAATLIKVSEDENVSTNNFSVKIKNAALKNTVSNALWNIKAKIFTAETLADKFKFYQNKKGAPVSSISSLLPSQTNSKLAPERRGTSPRRLGNKSHNGSKTRNNRKTQILAGLLMLLVLGYGNYRLMKNPEDQTDTSKDSISSYLSLGLKGQQPKVEGDSIASPEGNEIHPEIINTSSIAQGILPVDLSVLGNTIMLLDSSEKNLYQINPDTKETKSISKDFESVEYLRCKKGVRDDLCYVMGEGILYVLNPETPEKVNRYSIDIEGTVKDIFPFSNSLYILTENQIYTAAMGDTYTTAKPWLDDSKLTNAKSMVINNSSVYVLDGRNINRYMAGKIDSSFDIDESRLFNPQDIAIDKDKLYVLDADATLKQVVVYNVVTGDFIEKILLADNMDPEIPTLIDILAQDETEIIFFKGSSIFRAKEKPVGEAKSLDDFLQGIEQ